MKNYSKIDIFNLCMDALSQIWNLQLYDVFQNKLPAPMHVLLMMKWGLIYAEYPRNARKPFGANEFTQLYNEFTQLSALSDLLRDDDPLAIHKITRAIMSHQGNYQKKSGLHGLVLSEIIFGEIGIKYDSNRTFYEKSGLSVEEFISFQLILLESIVTDKRFTTYSLDNYQYLFAEYSKEKIRKYLHFISCDMIELQQFLTNDHKRISNPEFEYALLSSLYKKPLYRNGDNFTPYHTALIEANIEFSVYDILKEADPTRFCSPFGVAFEEYISFALGNASIPNLREKDIRKLTHRDSACDFMITDTQTTVFVEVKSAEMYYLTRQNPQEEILEKSLQNSIIKGYEQIISLVDHLKQKKDPIIDGKDVYGLIITFKDLLLGYPEVIWSEFMAKFMADRLEKRILDDLPINPSKIFVISAYDFDHMLAFANMRNITIAECLQIAYNRNNASGQRTIFFHDNFDDDSITVLKSPHLTHAYERISKRIELALKKGKRGIEKS